LNFITPPGFLLLEKRALLINVWGDGLQQKLAGRKLFSKDFLDHCERLSLDWMSCLDRFL
jgi:hypothetical protein